MARRSLGAGALAALAVLVAAAPAAAHGGAGVRAAADRPADARREAAVQLRGCFLNVALVPRPAGALRDAIPSPPDLTRTFYGADPLVSLWGLSCDGARVDGKRIGPVVLSLVAVPTGLTDPRAVPLANNFAHRLVRIDSSARTLALALRRRGLPANLTRRARGGDGRVVVPGQYRLTVRAVVVDQPHDHANRFERPVRGGRSVSLGLRDRRRRRPLLLPCGGRLRGLARRRAALGRRAAGRRRGPGGEGRLRAPQDRAARPGGQNTPYWRMRRRRGSRSNSSASSPCCTSRPRRRAVWKTALAWTSSRPRRSSSALAPGSSSRPRKRS